MYSDSAKLKVQALESSIRFYIEILGFDMVMAVPNTPPYHWAILRHGQTSLTLQAAGLFGQAFPPIMLQDGAQSKRIQVQVANVDILYRVIKEQVKVIQRPVDSPYGSRVFTVEDTDGHYITFSQAKDI